MLHNCAVFDCFSMRSKENNTRFFRFPQNEEEKKKWVYLCKRKDPINTKEARVCSLHFETSAFERMLKYELLNLPVPLSMRQLVDGALPTLKLPGKKGKFHYFIVPMMRKIKLT